MLTAELIINLKAFVLSDWQRADQNYWTKSYEFFENLPERSVCETIRKDFSKLYPRDDKIIKSPTIFKLWSWKLVHGFSNKNIAIGTNRVNEKCK